MSRGEYRPVLRLTPPGSGAGLGAAPADSDVAIDAGGVDEPEPRRVGKGGETKGANRRTTIPTEGQARAIGDDLVDLSGAEQRRRQLAPAFTQDPGQAERSEGPQKGRRLGAPLRSRRDGDKGGARRPPPVEESMPSGWQIQRGCAPALRPR